MPARFSEEKGAAGSLTGMAGWEPAGLDEIMLRNCDGYGEVRKYESSEQAQWAAVFGAPS